MGRSEGFGKITPTPQSPQAATYQRAEELGQCSRAQSTGPDHLQCKERRFTHPLFSPPGNSHSILGTRCSYSLLVTDLEMCGPRRLQLQGWNLVDACDEQNLHRFAPGRYCKRIWLVFKMCFPQAQGAWRGHSPSARITALAVPVRVPAPCLLRAFRVPQL